MAENSRTLQTYVSACRHNRTPEHAWSPNYTINYILIPHTTTVSDAQEHTHLAQIQSQRLGRIVLLVSVHSYKAVRALVPEVSRVHQGAHKVGLREMIKNCTSCSAWDLT